MNNLFHIHWIRPLWGWALIPLIILWFTAWRYMAKKTIWNRVCDAHLLPYLLTQERCLSRSAWFYLGGVGWLLAVIALTGPAWSHTEQPIYQAETARMIVLDLSTTMLASDLKPSRLERARFKVLDILKASAGREVGLVVFAGSAHIVSPLTTDAETIIQMLSVLTPDIMPASGDQPSSGLHLAQTLLAQAGALKRSELIILTDALDTEMPSSLLELKQQGVIVGILGLGTSEGAPVPLVTGGFLMDAQGQLQLSKLDERLFQTVAAEGGARYATLSPDQHDLDQVLTAKAAEQEIKTSVTRVDWDDQGIFLIWIILALALCAFRRGLLGLCLMTIPLLGFMSAGNATPVWQWKNPNQQAVLEFEQGQFAAAAAHFENPEWQGLSFYRNQDYEQAAFAFQKLDTADGHYNRGNALAQLHRYEEAIHEYEAALKRDPYHQDALANKAVIEQLKKTDQSPSSGTDAKKDQQPTQTPESSQSQSSPPGVDSESTALNKKDQSEASGTASVTPLPHFKTEKDAKNNQTMERVLKQVPDNPGGLLRRQFQQQYQQNQAQRRSL